MRSCEARVGEAESSKGEARRGAPRGTGGPHKDEVQGLHLPPLGHDQPSSLDE